MKTIFKWALGAMGKQTIEMPAGAHILDLQVQNNVPCLWGLVDEGRPPEKRTFLVISTGEPAEHVAGSDCEYVGTFQLDERTGPLAFHVFEHKPYRM